MLKKFSLCRESLCSPVRRLCDRVVASALVLSILCGAGFAGPLACALKLKRAATHVAQAGPEQLQGNIPGLQEIAGVENQTKIVGAIEDLSNGVPYMLLDIKTYQESKQAVEKLFGKKDARGTEKIRVPQQVAQESAGKLVAQGYDLRGRKGASKELEKRLADSIASGSFFEGHDPALNSADSYKSASGRFFIVYMQNPQQPFVPSEFENERFGTLLNYPGLDANILGPKAGALHRLCIVAHEVAHGGQARPEGLMPDEGWREREVYADTCAMAVIFLTDDKELASKFSKEQIRYREVSTAVNGDFNHAIYSELEDALEKLDPSYKRESPKLSEEDLRMAVAEMAYRFQVYYEDFYEDHDREVKARGPSQTLTEAQKKLVEMRKTSIKRGAERFTYSQGGEFLLRKTLEGFSFYEKNSKLEPTAPRQGLSTAPKIFSAPQPGARLL